MLSDCVLNEKRWRSLTFHRNFYFQPGGRAETRHGIRPLGADYMANFSPVSRAEILPQPSEQIFLKTSLRLHGENFSPS